MEIAENLVRAQEAAKILGLKRTTFLARNYPVQQIIGGIKFYNPDYLKRLQFIDRRIGKKKK